MRELENILKKFFKFRGEAPFSSENIQTEHEARANKFVKEVKKRGLKYRDLLIEVENETASLIDEAGKIKEFVEEEEGTEEAERFGRGIDRLDRESVEQTRVLIGVNGKEPRMIVSFLADIDSFRIKLDGHIDPNSGKIVDCWNIVPKSGKRIRLNLPESERFTSNTTYLFRAKK